MAQTIERIDEHNSRVLKDGKVLYNIKGSDLNYKNGANFEAVDCSFHESGQGDPSDFKTTKSNWKTGLLKVGKNDKTKWPVGIKYSDVQVKLALRKLRYFNKTTKLWSDIDEVDFINLDVNGNMVDAMENLDVAYTKNASSFDQTLKLKSNSALSNPYEEDGELSYWTQFNFDEEDLLVEADGVEWFGLLDIDAERVTFKKRSTGESILFFDSVHLKNNYADPEKLTYGTKDVSIEFGGRTFSWTKQKLITENKRLVHNDGAYFIVESVPFALVDEHDYIESGPLLLNYTTKTTATISANETLTAGTYEFQGTQTINSDATQTHAANVIAKATAGGGFPVWVLGDGGGAGIIDSNGTTGNRNYYVSEDDDSVGETISSSDGIPDSNDVTRWFDLANASSRITADYCTVRHGGATVNDWVVNVTAAGAGSTWNNSVFEHNGSSCFSSNGAAGAFVNCNVLKIRNNEVGTNGVIELSTGQLTNLVMENNLQNDGSNEFYQVYFTAGNGSFLKNCKIHATDVFLCYRIDSDASAQVLNCTFTGGSKNNNAVALFCVGSTVTNKYSIGTGLHIGSYQFSGTVTSSYNDYCYNDTNYNGTSKGTGDVEADPGFCPEGENQYCLLSTSPLHVTTPDKVNDAGFEYALGRLRDSSGTVLVAGDNIPPGYLYEAPASSGGGAFPPAPKYIGV
jgi:hypothetical protein